jgi:uncharacterized protein (TIGR02588 family)
MSRTGRGVGRKRTPLELGVLVVSILATAAVVVGLAVSAVTGGEGGPNVRATARPTGEERSGGAVYELTIRNDGGETAENVVIEVAVGDEVRELELLSVAKGDDETATVIFPSGTSEDATVRILSYHASTRG